MPELQILKAYKFALDPTPAQAAVLESWAGSARWAYNHALAAKIAAHEQWRTEVAGLVTAGQDEAAARKQVKLSIPSAYTLSNQWTKTRDLPREEGGSPWWPGTNRYVFIQGFRNADAAWKNWLDSRTGKRAGRKVGYPNFKKHRARKSFQLSHDVSKPQIRLVGHRRLRLPTFDKSHGSVRLHGSARRLAALIGQGRAVVQSVTVSKGGHRWYASLLCKVTVDVPDGPSRLQRARGPVGVDVGVKVLAALSKPLDLSDPASELVPNGRPLAAAQRRLRKAQKALSRKQKGSARRGKAVARVARLHHEVATRRQGALHQVTKRLAAGFSSVAVEDLNVAGMVRSAKGTVKQPGRNVRAKSGLNRAILDASPGEFRRQLGYKTFWYGSRLVVVDRWFPSSKTCSACGAVKAGLTLAERVFRCGACGLVLDRDVNAARNIEAAAAAL